MNTLFFLKCPLGDAINVSRFIFDYHSEYPNESIYVKCVLPFVEDLFKSCSFCNIWRNDIQYDKVYDYDLAAFDAIPEVEQLKSDGELVLQNVPYLYFKFKYSVFLEQKTKYVPIELDEWQMSTIAYDKPSCLVNVCAQYFGLDSRFLGYHKLQQIIDALRNRIDFIAIGNTKYNCLQTKEIKSVKLNLVNSTSIYELLRLVYNAKMVLTAESGIYHIAQIAAPKRRDIILTAGNRWRADMNHYSTPNVKIHWMMSSKKSCAFDLEHKVCVAGPLLKYINGIAFGTECKTPVIYDNELVSCCQADISAESVITEFEKILKEI